MFLNLQDFRTARFSVTGAEKQVSQVGKKLKIEDGRVDGEGGGVVNVNDGDGDGDGEEHCR